MIVALLLVPVAALLAVVAWDLTRSPDVRRLALHRVWRRPADALFMVLGSLFATAIISSAFLVGDTLQASIRDLARTQYGPADEVVVAGGLEVRPALESALAEPVPGTDGVLPVVSAPVTATRAVDGGGRLSQSRAHLHELDVASARRFGGDPGATGFAGAGETPGPGHALIGEDLAEDLRASVGDRLEIFSYGERLQLEVAGIVPRLGVAGFYPDIGARSPVLFVAPGTLEKAVDTRLVALPPTVRFLVSNEGGVFEGAEAGAEVRDELAARVSTIPGAEVQALKEPVLRAAEAEGRAVTQLFTGVGGFAVIAGVLLLVNLFVMQAEERKRELGVLRAVGMKRNRLIRLFGVEGGVYSVAAAGLGALAGVGVARVVVAVTAGLLAGDDKTLDLRFSATPASVATGALIGLAISLATTWLTSARIGRLQVIDAVAELAAPSPGRPSGTRVVVGAVGVAVGGVLLGVGVVAGVAVAALAGPMVAALCSIPLLALVLPDRRAATVAAVAALAWGIGAFSVLPGVFERSSVAVFLVQGVLLVAAGTTLTTANAAGYRRLAMLAFGRGRAGLASRLGFAYPLARPVRTGLLIGVFALVTFTLTFTAVITGIFSEQAPVLTRATSAGADLLVDSHPLTPVSEDDLTQVEGVAGTATLVRGIVSVEHPALGDAGTVSLAAGVDDGLLAEGVPALTDRDPAFADDAAAWQAVLRDPTLAVVSDLALQDTGDLPESPLEVGERFLLVDPATDRTLELTVAGVATADVQLNGVMLQRGVLEGLLAPQAVANRHYVSVDPGADPVRVAARLEGELYASGVSARTFDAVVDEALSKQQGFFRLMQGFLALGLVVGVAGLAVVMVRAVRERRRQIGMLRAIGYEPRTVRSYFLVEALFVSLRGVLLGCALGLVVSWSLLHNAGVTDRAGLRFVVPWAALVLVISAPLVCSLVAAALPASRAARISPSAALRMAD